MSEVLTQIRVLDMMDQDGHTSFGWDDTDDEWVLPMIREKLAQGYIFWIVQRNPLREVRLERIDDIGDSRHVIIRDDASRSLFEQGRIGLVTSVDTVVRRARTAEEVVSNDTIAHRGLRSG